MLTSFLLDVSCLGIVIAGVVVVIVLVAGAGRSRQPRAGMPTQYPPQYPTQYPSQYPPQYPAQYPPQVQPPYPGPYAAPQYPAPPAPQYPAPRAPQYAPPSPYGPQYGPSPVPPQSPQSPQPQQRPMAAYPQQTAWPPPYAPPQQPPATPQYAPAPMPAPAPAQAPYPPAPAPAFAPPAPAPTAAAAVPAPAVAPPVAPTMPATTGPASSGGQASSAQQPGAGGGKNVSARFNAAAVTADPYAPPLPPLPVVERVTLDPPAAIVPCTDLAPHDIYLSLGARSEPQIGDLAAHAPALSDPVIAARMRQSIISHLDPNAPDDLHPLGLDLPQDLAVAVAQRIRAAGGDGVAAPSAYRSPLVPLSQALAIADVYFAPQMAQEFPGAQYRGDISHWGHGARWWMIEAVLAYPDGRPYFADERTLACVDKLDGHVWPLEEVHRASTLGHQAPAAPAPQQVAGAATGGARQAASAGWAANANLDANPTLYLSMAAATFEMGAYDEALQLFDRAIQLGVNTWAPYWGRSRCLDRLGRRDEALEAVRQAEARNADPAVVAPDHCALLIHMGRDAEALGVADQFLASHPPEFFVVVNRARALFGLGRYAEAIAAYDQALGFEPSETDRAMIWAFKGLSLARLSRFDEALAAFDRSITLGETPVGKGFNADKDRQQQQADNWRNKGICLNSLTRHAEAVEAYDRCLAIRPNDVLALTLKARTLVTLQRYSEAYEAVSRALPLKPDGADLLEMKAVLAAQLRRPDDMEEALHRLRAIDPAKAAQLSAQLTTPDAGAPQ